MADLQIDTAALRETGAALRVVALGLDGAPASSAAAAGAVGHPRLAERVLEFSRSWDDRRNAVVEGIAHLADAAERVGQTYEAIETELVAALRGEA